MNFFPQIFLGCLLYFGALIVPAFYFLFTRWHGKAKKPMLVGICLQIFGSCVVIAYAYFAWRAGNPEAGVNLVLLFPVNFVGLIYFLMVLFIYALKTKK